MSILISRGSVQISRAGSLLQDKRFVRTAPGIFDTTLDFVSSTSDAAAGVSGTAGATNGSQQFSFAAITPTVGVPLELEIKESTVLKLIVVYPSDYAGQSYQYITTAGVSQSGTFPAVSGEVNY